MQIEAKLHLTIDHRSGPVIDDADHVRRWMVADGARINGAYNGFTYEVCPVHADPDECDCNGTVAIYAATIAAADWDD